MPIPAILAGLGLAGALGGGVLSKDIDLIPGFGPNEAAREADRRAAAERTQRENVYDGNSVLNFDANGNVYNTGVDYTGPNSTPTYANTNNSPTLGGSGGGNYASAAQLAEYEQARGQLEHGLSRLDSQLDIALGNVGKQYGVRSNELDSSFSTGQNRYGSQTTQNKQDRRGNINNINDQSSSDLRNLLRKLGSMGAVGSDMGLVSRAVQDQSNSLRSGAGQVYAQNQRSLDTNWDTFKKDIEDDRRKLADWRNEQTDSARSQSAQTRQGLLNQLASLRAQEASARGANGAAAARADLNSSNALSAQIDNLARLNPTYTGKRIDYTPQSLDSYSVRDNTTMPANQNSPTTSTANNPTFKQATEDDEELRKRNQLY